MPETLHVPVGLLCPTWEDAAVPNGIVAYTRAVRAGLAQLGARSFVLVADYPRPCASDEVVFVLRKSRWRRIVRAALARTVGRRGPRNDGPDEVVRGIVR